MDKPIRLEARVRNNRMYKCIYGKYTTLSQFCKENGFHPAVIGELLNLKQSPFDRSGEYRSVCKTVADHFHYNVSDLFPKELYSVDQPIKTFEVGFSQLPHQTLLRLVGPGDIVEDIIRKDMTEQLEHIMKTLSQCEQDVIRGRFGWEGTAQTQQEVAEAMGLTINKVRAIEKKALTKLRHPNRNRGLLDYV